MKQNQGIFLSLAIFAGLLAGAFSENEIPDSKLETFLRNALGGKFSRWSHWETGLIPSRPNPTNYVFFLSEPNHFFNISCIIKNEQVVNVNASLDRAFISLNEKILKINLYLDWPVFRGIYYANGTLGNGDPIIANSTWRYSVKDLMLADFEYDIDVSSDGYIVISESPKYFHMSPYLWTSTMVFDNLYENGCEGYGQVLKIGLQRAYENQIANFYPEHAIGNVLQRYFTELFQNSTLVDIIGTTSIP